MNVTLPPERSIQWQHYCKQQPVVVVNNRVVLHTCTHKGCHNFKTVRICSNYVWYGVYTNNPIYLVEIYLPTGHYYYFIYNGTNSPLSYHYDYQSPDYQSPLKGYLELALIQL